MHGLASQVISIKEYSITSITKYQYNSQRCKYIWMGSLAGPMNRCGLSNYSEYGSESALGSLEAVPIGAGTHLDGKCFVWLRQKLLKSVRIPASFFLARQKFFLPICIPSPIGTASKISPHTSWRRIFRPDFVKNPCNPPGLRRLFALLDKKSPRQSPHAEILNRL